MDKEEILAKVKAGQIDLDEASKLLEQSVIADKLRRRASGHTNPNCQTTRERKTPVSIPADSFRKMLDILYPRHSLSEFDSLCPLIALRRYESVAVMRDGLAHDLTSTSFDARIPAVNEFKRVFAPLVDNRKSYVQVLIDEAESLREGVKSARGHDRPQSRGAAKRRGRRVKTGRGEDRPQKERPASITVSTEHAVSPERPTDSIDRKELEAVLACVKSADVPPGRLLISVKTKIPERRLNVLLTHLVDRGQLKKLGSGREIRFELPHADTAPAEER